MPLDTAFLIPLFFVSIGLSSNFRSLGGHWLLLGAIFLIAVVSKLLGCGVAALARGMGSVRSFRIGCGMVSRGEVGLIVTAMGAASGVFRRARGCGHGFRRPLYNAAHAACLAWSISD